MSQDKILNLKKKAEEIRKRLVEIVFAAKGGHIGGSLSSVEMETALYFRVMNVDQNDP